MKKGLSLFLALALLFSVGAAAQDEVDYDAEIQESEAAARETKTKTKKRSKVQSMAGKNMLVKKGLVCMETVGESGAVLFYVANGKKLYPAVETTGYGQSNYISLYVEGREYRLNKSGNCKYFFEVDDNSITETFTVRDVAELKAVYKISKIDSQNELENSVVVNYSLKSLSEKKKAIALKAVYNLRLGENRNAHFSSPLKNEIGGEYVVFPSEDESWIISSDSMNAVEVVVFGDGVTPPKKAVVANKDVIELSTPATSFTPGNSFDSILSYNNSSLGLFWQPVELGAKDVANYSYKINFSISDFQNSGKARVIPAQKSEDAPAAEEEKKQEAEEGQIPVDIEYNDPSKLNAEYVQQLINHINSLEQSDPSLNKMKIQQLQQELDEVLQVLRSRK